MHSYKVNRKYGAKARNMHSKPNAVTVIKGFIVLGTFFGLFRLAKTRNKLFLTPLYLTKISFIIKSNKGHGFNELLLIPFIFAIAIVTLFSSSPSSSRKHIEVHGRPTPAVFRSSPEAGGKSTYHLTWTVDSYSPIIEYRLLYRQIQAYHRVS